jgi:CRISPR-associated protein Cmr5
VTQQQSKAASRQTIEQERGRAAWNDVREIKKLGSKERQEYRSRARGFNAMVQINGMGQTLGFFYAKSKNDKGQPDRENAHYQILNHLTTWMRDRKHFSAANADKIGSQYDGLLAWVLDKDTSSSDYRRATTECLAFGRWLSRFAEAELAEDNSPARGTSEGVDNGR